MKGILGFNYIPIKCEISDHYNKEIDDCIYAHTNNEISYHIYYYKLRFCKNLSCDRGLFCPKAHGNNELRKIYYDNNRSTNQNITDALIYISKDSLFAYLNTCTQSIELPTEFSLDTFKVYKCPNGTACPIDYHDCYNYHSLLERRRDPRLYEIDLNLSCSLACLDGKWIEPQCPKVN